MKNNYPCSKKNSIKLLSILSIFFVFAFSNSVNAQDCTVNAGIDETICETETMTLNGVVGGNIVSYKWQQLSGPTVVIENPTTAVTNVLGAVGGNTYTFRISAVCAIGTTFQDVTITVDSNTLANAGANIEGCPGTYSLSGNSPGVNESGMWVILGTNGSGVNIETPTSRTSNITFPAASAGTSTLQWTITSSNGCSTSDTIDVTNFGGEVIANAGPDQTLSECYTSVQNTVLNGSIGGDGTGGQGGTWSFVSGPTVPSIVSPTSLNTVVNNLAEGVYTFRWTVVGPCAIGEDTVTITVPAPTQTVTTAGGVNRNQRFCTGSITETILQGNVPSYAGETVQWTQTQGPAATIVSPNSPTTQVIGLNGSSNYTFTYTITSPPLGDPTQECSSTSTFTVRYSNTDTTVLLNSGTDIEILPVNATSGNVPLTSTGGTNFSYQIISGPALSTPATFYNTGGINGAVGSFNFSGLTKIGTYIIRVTRYNSGNILTECSSASDDINIVVSLNPTVANAGTSVALLCGITTTQLSGNIPTQGSGYWSQVNGPNTAIFSDIYVHNPTVSGLDQGIYTFRWQISGGPAGTDAFSETQVTVSQPPVADAGPSPVTICAGSYEMLAGALVPGQTGLWEYVSGPIGYTIADTSDPNTYVTGLQINSTYVFQWTVKSAATNCIDAQDSVTINTTATFGPSPADAGGDQCFDSGTTTATLTAIETETPFSGIGTWTFVSGPATPTITPSISDPFFQADVTGMTANGTYVFQWKTETDPLCNVYNDTMEITIADTPTSVAGSNQNVCTDIFGNSITMDANEPSPGLVGTWVQVSGDGTWSVSNINDPKAVFSNLVPGNYVFEWLVERGTCDSASSNMSFTVSLPATVATVGVDQNVCGTSTTLTGNAISNGTGTWQMISGPSTPNFSNYNSPDAAVTGLTTGQYVFRWTSANGPFCPSYSADLTVDVYAPAIAGPNQNLCAATEVLLQGTPGATGTWTETSSNGAIINTISGSTASAAILPGNTYTFQFAIAAAGSCAATTASMQVVNSALPLIPIAGPDQDICTATATFVTMAGNGVTGDGTWTRVSGPNMPTITSPTNPATTVTGLIAGIYIFQWTTSNGNCLSLSDVVRINVYNPPSAAVINTVDNSVACQLSSQLDAVAPAVGIGTWTLSASPAGYVPGNIIIASPNNNITGITVPNPNTLPLGVYEFTWTVTNGPICAAEIAKVKVNYDGVPPTPSYAGNDQALCDVTLTNLGASPVDPTETGKWTVSSKPVGSATVVFSNAFNPNAQVSALEEGIYIFTWTVENIGGGCSFSDDVQVTITKEVAAANAGPDQNLSQFDNIIMAATATPSPSIGKWTFVSGPTTPVIIDVNDPNSYIAGTIPGTYEFTWTVKNGACATTSDNVIININAVTDLSLLKTTSNPTPNVGGIITFNLAVTNEGSNNATGISVTDVLPIGYTIVPGTINNGGVYNIGGNSINWVGLSVLVGNTLNLSFNVTVNASTGVIGEYLNSAQIMSFDQIDSDSTPGNNDPTEDDQSEISTNPVALINLALDKKIDNLNPYIGSNVTFTITVSNSGPSNATGVQVTDVLPSGYTFVSATTSVNSYNELTGIWNVGNIAKGFNETLEIIATVNSLGNYQNTAEVTDADQQDSNSTPGNGISSEDDQDTVTPVPVPEADLSLTKVIKETGPYNVGSNITFSVTVTNIGPNTATGVTVVDYLPSGYTYVSDTGLGTYSNVTGSWNVGTINSGASSTLEIVATINATGSYRNVAEVVHSNQFDPDSTPGNNDPLEDDQDQVVITPVQVADLSLVKTVDIANPIVGSNVTFTLALNNAGPSNTTSVVVNDQLPLGYTFVSYTSTSGTYDSTSGNWTLSGSVLNGKTEYLAIVAKVNPITGAANEYKNDAEVTASGQTDPDSTPDNDEPTEDDQDDVITTPTALIDLSLRKSVDKVEALVGSTVVFTIEVSNAGPSDATGILVEDALPSGYSFVSDDSGGSYSSGIWTIGNLANGSTAILNITATVNATGDYTNIAEITAADQPDVDSTPDNGDLGEDDQDQVTTSKIPLVNISLTKIVDNDTPNIGTNVKFTIEVSNAGPSDATEVVVTDKLPTGYQFINAVPSAGTTYNNIQGSWTIGNLANAATVTLEIEAKVLPTGNYNNIAEVTGTKEIDSNSTPGNNDATEDDQMEVLVTPIQIADLSVIKEVDNLIPNVGANVTFTINVTNAGPSDATGVLIADLLPSGYQFVSASSTAGMYNKTTGIWTVSRPIIANTTETLQITAKVLESGDYTNNAEVTASNQIDSDSTPDDGTGDDFSTVTTTPVPLVNLILVKRINNATPDVGSTVVFTIEIVNNGPSDATTVVANDVLPSGYSWVSDDSAGSYIPGSGIWTIGNLANAATATLNISATVNTTGDYTNTANVTSFENEGNPVDNTSSISSTPRPIADLSLTKSVVNSAPNVGENTVFNLVVKNDGPSDATGVVVTDKLPSGYLYVSSVPSAGSTYANTSGAWVVGNLANGASATLTITAKVLATGDYTNVAEVTGSNQHDPDSTPHNNNPNEDDQAEVVVNPINEADLVTTKTIITPPADGTYDEGDTFIYTITVLNNGGSTVATNVTLTDILPAGVTYVSNDQGAAYNSGSGIWTIGSIAVDASITLNITATINAGTSGDTITNTTTAAKGDQTDPTTAGDDLVEAITVNDYTDIVLTKVVDNATPNVGDIIKYTITVTNKGPAAVTNLVLTDNLPTGLTYTDANYSTGTITGPGIWSVGSVAPGVTENIEFEVLVGVGTGGSTLINTVSNAQDQTDSNLTPDDDTETIIVTSSNLVTVKVVDNLTPVEGATIAYTISVTNKGLSDATGVMLTDNLPVGVTYASHSTANGTFNNGSGIWTIGNIANGATATLTINAKVDNGTGGTTINNHTDAAIGDQSDPTTAEDILDAVITVVDGADIVLTKVVNNSTPNEGSTVVYTVTVENKSLAPVTNLVVTDDLPVGLTYGVVSPGAGTWSAPNWAVGTLIPGGKATLTIEALVGAGTLGQILTNTVTNTQDQYDTNATTDDDSATITVTSVDLVTIKTVSDSSPNEGDTITYTIEVSNTLGGSNATGVNITDNLPVGVTYLSHSTVNGTYNQGSGLWNIGNLENGDTAILLINATVNSGTIGLTISNVTSNAIADQADVDNSNNSDSAIIIPVANIDLSLTKTVLDNEINPIIGNEITFEIRVDNAGPTKATGVQVTDLLPSGYSLNNYSSTIGTYNPSSGIWDIGIVETGKTAVLLLNVMVLDADNYENCAEITSANENDIDSTPNNGQNAEDDSDCAQVVPQNIEIDLSLTKTVVNNRVRPLVGDKITFEIRVENAGPSKATGVKVTDLLPSGYSFENYNSTIGTYNSSTGTWDIGTVEVGVTAVLMVEVTVLEVGIYENCAEITAANEIDIDSTPNNGQNIEDDSDCVQVVPQNKKIDLSLTKVVVNDKVRPLVGDEITFEIRVENAGPSEATGVQVTDLLPSGYSFENYNSTIGTYNSNTGIWDIGTVEVGVTAVLMVEVTVLEVGDYINCAEITSANENDIDSTPGNGQNEEDDSACVIVIPYHGIGVDLSLTKTVLNNEVNPLVGDEITFEIRVENTGSKNATGVQVTDLLPSGYSFENYSSTIGTYNPSTGIWNIGIVEVDKTAVLLVTVIVLEGNDYENCAEITKVNEKDIDSTPGNGANSEDDYDCATVNAIFETDLGITKTIVANNTSPLVNTEITFEIRVTNYGQITATQVEVTDLLPSGYQFVNYSATTGVFSEITGLWNLGRIVAGDTETILIDVIVNAVGDFNNCVSISNMRQIDSNIANNSSCIEATPIAMADLDLTKDVDNNEPEAESEVNFTIVVSNAGPSDATGVLVEDLLPSGYNFVSYTTSSGTYNENTGIWNVGKVVNQTAETLTITAYVKPYGDWLNIAQIVAANEFDVDSTPGNNDAYEDDQAKVAVKPKVSIFIPEEFTPNGDGINDVFEIEHLQVLYPDFKMEIINRWGNKVYEYTHNGNAFDAPIWWNGYSDGRWNLGNSELPVGTYFYVIYFNNNDRKPETGWIYLKR